MALKYSHQLITGVSFGVTSGVITALGMIVGLNEATSSRLAVLAGIVIMAIADGMADAAGFHIVEEAEVEYGKVKHSTKEVWMTTIFIFLAVCGFILTFAVPILLLQLRTAIYVDIAWGLFLLVILNFFIAKVKNESPLRLISGHVFLAVFVIAVSYLAGNLIAVLI